MTSLCEQYDNLIFNQLPDEVQDNIMSCFFGKPEELSSEIFENPDFFDSDFLKKMGNPANKTNYTFENTMLKDAQVPSKPNYMIDMIIPYVKKDKLVRPQVASQESTLFSQATTLLSETVSKLTKGASAVTSFITKSPKKIEYSPFVTELPNNPAAHSHFLVMNPEGTQTDYIDLLIKCQKDGKSMSPDEYLKAQEGFISDIEESIKRNMKYIVMALQKIVEDLPKYFTEKDEKEAYDAYIKYEENTKKIYDIEKKQKYRKQLITEYRNTIITFQYMEKMIEEIHRDIVKLIPTKFQKVVLFMSNFFFKLNLFSIKQKSNAAEKEEERLEKVKEFEKEKDDLNLFRKKYITQIQDLSNLVFETEKTQEEKDLEIKLNIIKEQDEIDLETPKIQEIESDKQELAKNIEEAKQNYATFTKSSFEKQNKVLSDAKTIVKGIFTLTPNEEMLFDLLINFPNVTDDSFIEYTKTWRSDDSSLPILTSSPVFLKVSDFNSYIQAAYDNVTSSNYTLFEDLAKE